jgi:hypothetical protein
MNQVRVQEALEGAIFFLERRQLPSGEIPLYRLRLGGNDQWEYDETMSGTAIAAISLTSVSHPTAVTVRQRALGFLCREMLVPGAWKFWSQDHPNAYWADADVDDTVLASLALERAHPHIAMGSNLELLLENIDERGRFKTWLRSADSHNDVDPVVNANAVAYVGPKRDTTIVCSWLNRLVFNEEGIVSHYYVQSEAFFYALSRAFRRGVSQLNESRERAICQLAGLRKPDGSYGDVLATAYVLCALRNYQAAEGDETTEVVDWLLEQQTADGSWPLIKACAGPEPPNQPSVWWGSAELTTALVVEALCRRF